MHLPQSLKLFLASSKINESVPVHGYKNSEGDLVPGGESKWRYCSNGACK